MVKLKTAVKQSFAAPVVITVVALFIVLYAFFTKNAQGRALIDKVGEIIPADIKLGKTTA